MGTPGVSKRKKRGIETGTGFNVSRAPSKLRIGSEPTSTRIESPGKKMDAPEADRTKNSRQGKNEIDTCPRTVL